MERFEGASSGPGEAGRSGLPRRPLPTVWGDSGLVLFRGNNDQAAGVSTSSLADLGRLGSPWEIPDVVARLEARLGRELTFTEASRELGRQARVWMLGNPGRALGLMARRAALVDRLYDDTDPATIPIPEAKR